MISVIVSDFQRSVWSVQSIPFLKLVLVLTYTFWIGEHYLYCVSLVFLKANINNLCLKESEPGQWKSDNVRTLFTGFISQLSATASVCPLKAVRIHVLQQSKVPRRRGLVCCHHSLWLFLRIFVQKVFEANLKFSYQWVRN